MIKPSKLALAIAVALASSHAFAVNTEFDNFTPLTASAGPIPIGGAGEATPITLSSPQFSQRTLIERNVQTGLGQFNSGNFDMITSNENGPDAGRYLYTVFETGQSGIMRHDLQNNTTSTIWRSPAAAPSNASHVAFDASYWTPWGTYITAEESWETNAAGSTSPFGRLFEVTNPLDRKSVV